MSSSTKRGAAFAAAVLACCLLAGCGGMVEDTMEVDTTETAAARSPVAPPTEPAKPPEPVWQPIFNGKDLTGWTVGGRDLAGLTSSKGGSGWVVEDGVLVRGAGGGYIWTKERFADFVLDFEFNTTGNSGVFFRTDNTRNCVATGIEMQIEKKGGPGRRHGLGAIYDCLAPSEEVGKPGEWNHATLTCNDNKITVVMNGKRIIDMDLDKWDTPRKNPDGSGNKFGTALKDFKRDGHIGLQDHGHQVMYRNIRIRKL